MRFKAEKAPEDGASLPRFRERVRNEPGRGWMRAGSAEHRRLVEHRRLAAQQSTGGWRRSSREEYDTGLGIPRNGARACGG